MQSTGERESFTELPLISVKETAHLLKISRVMVYRRFHAGQFPGRKLGRKIDLYQPFVSALHAAISAGRSVDVDEFARQWSARNAQASPEPAKHVASKSAPSASALASCRTMCRSRQASAARSQAKHTPPFSHSKAQVRRDGALPWALVSYPPSR